MAKIEINGTEYKLRFDMYAMEMTEEAFGGIKDMFDALKAGKNNVKTIRTLFRILVNAQRNYDGEEEDPEVDSVLKHLRIPQLNEISTAIKDALDEGMRVETVNGPADDNVHDGYLEQIDREKKTEGAD